MGKSKQDKEHLCYWTKAPERKKGCTEWKQLCITVRSGITKNVFLCKVTSFVKCPFHWNTKNFIVLVELRQDSHLTSIFLTGADFVCLVYF